MPASPPCKTCQFVDRAATQHITYCTRLRESPPVEKGRASQTPSCTLAMLPSPYLDRRGSPVFSTLRMTCFKTE